MMKSRLLAGFLAVCFSACEPAADYKTVRKEVVDEHDKVMLDSERALENRDRLERFLLKLDSVKQVKPALDTMKVRKELQTLNKKLNSADLEMETWMKEFDAELGDKSNSEAVAYFNGEKEKLRKMDTLFQKLLTESGEYLRRLR
ncbi:MAG: hypothetical protein V4721_13120 [Bacteroidota bacterium]